LGAASDAPAWLAEADRLHYEKQFGAAAEHYREALARDASLFDAWYGLGFAQCAAGEYGEAARGLREALALQPDATRLRVNLAESLFALGRVSEAVREYERAIREGDRPTREMALANLACIAPGDPAMDNQAILHARRRWAEAVSPAPSRPDWRPGERLRIGYLSSFFGARNWMKMFMGVINRSRRPRPGIATIRTIASGMSMVCPMTNSPVTSPTRGWIS